MNNHFHLVMKLDEPEKLSSIMAGISRSYVHYHHRKYDSAGYLWQGRYKSQAIEKELYLLVCGRYVERNPVRAKIVNSAWEWIHSSAKFYALGIDDRLTDSDPVYEEWGKMGKEIQLRQYQEWLSEEVDEAEEEFFRNAAKPVGSEGFLTRLIYLSGRQMPRRQGRAIR